jgi:hypothetical protein
MGYELDRLMKQYGVSSPSIAPYTADISPNKPVAPIAPAVPTNTGGLATRLGGFLSSSKPADYVVRGFNDGVMPSGLYKNRMADNADDNASYAVDKAAYDKSMAAYNSDMAAYNARVPNNEDNRALYDKYRSDYIDRVSETPMYNQSQFGVANPTNPTMLTAPVFASRGGSMEDLAEKYGVQRFAYGSEDPFDSAARRPEDTDPEMDASTAYAAEDPRAGYTTNPSIEEGQRQAKSQQDTYFKMFEDAAGSPEMSRIGDQEKYFRLASAFLSPTKTGAFGENLALAGDQMADMAKSDREAKMSVLKLRLAAQKARMDAAQAGVNAQIKAAGPSLTPYQKQMLENSGRNIGLREDAQGLRERQAKYAYEERARKEQAKIAPMIKARQNVSNTIAKMKEVYKELNDLGEMVDSDPNSNELGNLVIAAKSLPVIGDIISAKGDRAGQLRKELEGYRSQIFGQVARASGLGATNFNTEKEMENVLKGLGNPFAGYSTNMAILDNIEQMSGVSSAPAERSVGREETLAPVKTVDFGALK